MKFSTVANYFDQIELLSGRLDMTKKLAELFSHATPKELEIIVNLALGQLHPIYQGTQFNLAEKSMVGVVTDFLGSTTEQIKKQIRDTGDLGSVISTDSQCVDGHISVLDVYQQLMVIEQESGTGSQERKVGLVKQLLQAVDACSAKYIVRIIIGKLRLGFSDMTVIDALSWMECGDKSLHTLIEHAYNVCADLGLIAHDLKKNGVAGLKTMQIHVGIPIRPAAAERMPTAQAIFEKIGRCVAQPKLDGFRLQIHVDKTKTKPVVHFFSRHLQDMSAMFPDLIGEFENLDVKTLVCEGEAIGYDVQTDAFLPFQETAKRRRKHGIKEAAAAFPLRIFLFDILYINGNECMSFGHEERRAVLQELFVRNNMKQVQLVAEVPVSTVKELEDYFQQEVEAGLEGLVVKKPQAPYQPGKRNFNWIKLKRRQQGHLEDTIDCVVLGYYHGAGKRSTFGIGAFLVGIYNKHHDRFETIAKVGTGLKDEAWKQLKKKCDELKINHAPKNVMCAKELVPDVWVEPEVVCAVLADEITLSPTHSAGKTSEKSGFALRFPRFVGYREDKKALEATELGEIRRLYDDQY